MSVNQLELIASLRERATELRFLADKLKDIASGSAIRLRQVADICEQDAAALQLERDDMERSRDA